MCIVGTLPLRWVILLWLVLDLKRLPKHFNKKLHTRAMDPYHIIKTLGSNAYVLDLADHLGSNPIFNVDDLTLPRGTFKPLYLPLGASACTGVLKFPPFLHPHPNVG